MERRLDAPGTPYIDDVIRDLCVSGLFSLSACHFAIGFTLLRVERRKIALPPEVALLSSWELSAFPTPKTETRRQYGIHCDARSFGDDALCRLQSSLRGTDLSDEIHQLASSRKSRCFLTLLPRSIET